MKKLIKWATAGAAAALLFSSLAFAQTPISPPPGTTVIVEPVSSQPSGFKVCYLPQPRHVEASRIVQRCGPYGGCQNFRVVRSFDVTAYTDCHIEKSSCSRGYKKFGWYPNKSEARDAVYRCQNTFSGNVPGNWKMNPNSVYINDNN